MRVPCYIEKREEEGQFVPSYGGGSGIRTHDTLAGITVFKFPSPLPQTCYNNRDRFSRNWTLPCGRRSRTLAVIQTQQWLAALMESLMESQDAYYFFVDVCAVSFGWLVCCWLFGLLLIGLLLVAFAWCDRGMACKYFDGYVGTRDRPLKIKKNLSHWYFDTNW